MSHTATIDLEIKDLDVFEQSCRDLEYRFTREGTAKLYDRTIDNCSVVSIPDWNYPVAVKDGKLYYDNYNGAWGDMARLHALKRQYARNTTLQTARARGFRVQEQQVDGKIQLRLSR